MTSFEFIINFAIILLLIPTVIYAAILNRKLNRMQSQQENMIKLAQALGRAADGYEKITTLETTPAPHNRVEKTEPIFSSNTDEENMVYASFAEKKQQDLAKTPNFSGRIAPCFSAPTENEHPSETELELLQALRSIK